MKYAGIIVAASVLWACEEEVDTLPPLDPAAFSCTSCHGGIEGSAPPRAIDGATSTTAVSVGAHRGHALGGNNSRPVACDACHLVPATLLEPGHVDTPLPAEVAMTTGTWDHAVAGCSNTYCHGTAEPSWVRPNQAACGSCHGLPPPPPHPTGMACEGCHGAVAGPGLTIRDRMRHADGHVDFQTVTPTITPASCAAGCHGTDDEPTPASGAHLAHLSGGAQGKPVACGHCHLVPATIGAPGHNNGTAEVMFSGTAGTSGTYAGGTCNNTYCHNSSGGATTQPVWTGPATTCSSCHGFPPPNPHPSSASCSGCHSNARAGMNVDRATHVDGTVNF